MYVKNIYVGEITLHGPLMAWYTCLLEAGQAVKTSCISHLLPNFNTLLHALTNTYLGLRKSKDWYKAKSTKKKYPKDPQIVPYPMATLKCSHA